MSPAAWPCHPCPSWDTGNHQKAGSRSWDIRSLAWCLSGSTPWHTCPICQTRWWGWRCWGRTSHRRPCDCDSLLTTKQTYPLHSSTKNRWILMNHYIILLFDVPALDSFSLVIILLQGLHWLEHWLRPLALGVCWSSPEHLSVTGQGSGDNNNDI